MSASDLWQRYQDYLYENKELGLSMDISRMNFSDDFFEVMSEPISKAFAEMKALEAGAVANPDEQRMVGHYWLRNTDIAPKDTLKTAISEALQQIKAFTAKVHSGEVKPATADQFTNVLVIGIGGSALGPQFVADALGEPATDKLTPYFFDNTDPNGMQRTLATIGDDLKSTLSVVISKSGGTPETRNGMLIAKAAYEAKGLDFGKHAVAVTGEGSKLYKFSQEAGWLEFFPMWDWVGGRTSELCAVGLLPAALQGLDIQGMLDGAAACDEVTRSTEIKANPAGLLALMWYYATNGKGEKDMVVLPYKDRLLLFSRYLQQLVMESLGKKEDLDGVVVEQGIAVYGNKGSTDQHAYVQQLREGVNNFFATFIETLEDGGTAMEVEPGVTAGDYLHGFMMGTREALYEGGRESITITVPRVEARTIGILIALYERAVGFYATLVNINAYHQPGVEAGKKAAASILDLQGKVMQGLTAEPTTAAQLAEAIGAADRVEAVYKLLSYQVANGKAKIADQGDAPGSIKFSL